MAEARVEGAEPGDLRLERLPLYFVENRGQADERVSYYLQGRETAVYFTPQGVTYSLTGSQSGSRTDAARAGSLEGSASPVEARVRAVSYGGDDARLAQPVSRWAVKLDFVEANTDVRMEGVGRTPAVVSYFKGTSFEGRTGLPTYSQVAYRDLWPGIDLVYSGTVDRLKYQFVVRPGADPDQIRLAYRGAAVAVNADGQLEVSTPVAGFRDDKPLVYQHVYQRGGGEKIEVAAAYRLEPRVEQGTVEQRAKRGAAARRAASTASASPEGGYTFGFELGAYDPSRVLIIDPSVLVYAGYIGGTALDRGADVAVDSAGNAYVTGETLSAAASFPVAAGPDLTFNGDTDAFVAKVNAAGTALVYAGYLGGAAADRGASIAVDAAGAAYLTGETESDATTFPTLIGPDLTFNGGTRDAFVAKIDPSGTALLYAGYIGGDEADAGQGIAVDAAGNAYVTGGTLSEAATFPVAVGPDLTFNGGQDGFVAKVNAAGTALLYAGYLGGSADDRGFDIAVWGEGEVFVTGETSSAEDSFPVTVGPDLTYNGGLSDAFVVKVRADGTVLDYAGYVGGEATDIGHGIAVDADGKATIAGETGSDETTFPVVRGPDLTYNGGLSDAFAAQVAPDGTALIYAGYIGGDSLDAGHAIALDASGNAFLTGDTVSTEATFPASEGAQGTFNGARDAFLAEVSSAGNTLIYAGYFGGAGVDIGNGVAVDSEGSVYVAGETTSVAPTFPATTGPDLTFNGVRDAFVLKVIITGPILTAEGVVNAASFLGGPVAAGEIISIFGVGIGPDPGVNSTFDENGNVPVELAGVQVLINGIPAPLYFVSEFQINCQVPYEVEGLEEVTVQVIVNGVMSNIVTVEVAETAPGLFTLESGIGQVIAVLFPGGTLNTAENPVAPGQIVTLYGTGEGQTTPAGQTGVPVDVPLPIPIADVVVLIGGVEQTILYVGGAPGFAGLLQINIEIVAGTPVGPAVPIVVIIGGVGSAGALEPEALQPEEATAEPKGTGGGGEGEVTIAISGDPDNQGPLADPQMVMTDEDVPVSITLTGSDPDGDELAFSITRSPVNGVLSDLVPTGPTSATVSYSPVSNFNGPDSFEFQVMDPGGRLSRADVTIDVKPVSDPPQANNDAAVVVRNTPKVIDVLRNDFDPDGDELTISGVSTPANGTAAPDEGGILYTPDTDYLGPDGFEYTITDANGKTIDSATVTILVQPGEGPNNDPIANAQDVMTNENVPLPVTLTGSDPDGDDLVFSIVTNPLSGSLGPVTQLVGEMGLVTYTPNTNFDGTDRFEFAVVDDRGGGATAFVDILVKPVSDLAVTKTNNRPSILPGASLAYEIVVANNGPSEVVGATVVDIFPPELINVSWTCRAPPAGSCPAMGVGNIAATVDIPAGAAVIFTANADLAPGATGTVTNTAMATAPAGTVDPTGNNTATDSDPIVPPGDLQITKTNGVNAVVPGTTVIYTIVVSNVGGLDANGATVMDTFPAALTNVTWTCMGTAGTSCTAMGSGNINDVVTIPAGGMISYTVTAQVDPSVTGTLSNLAMVTPPLDFADQDRLNNEATDSDPLTPEADLAITKMVSSVDFKAGQAIEYTIEVTNNGPSTATGVQVTDTLPPALQNAATVGCSPDPGLPVCALGTLLPLASASYMITGDIPPSERGDLTNMATASSDVTDPVAGNETASDTTPINVMADLRIEKTDSIDPAIAGQDTITYTITVNNDGPADATSVVVTDTLPAGVTFVQTVGCTEDALGVPTCSLGTIPVGGMASYTAEVTVDSSTTGAIENAVQVDSPDDPMIANNTTTEPTMIDTLADLNITKTVLTAPVIAGQSVQYEVTVNNPGPSDALNVSVTDMIPAPSMAGTLTYNAGLSSAECSASGAMMTGDTVTCTVASIPAGGMQMFTIVFDLSSDSMGTLDNTATVASDTPEADATDNTAAAPPVTIEKDADLQMEKTPVADPVVAGTQVTYTLKVTNQGPSDAESIEVTDTLPAELSNPVATPPCVIGGAGPFTWTVGDLAAGAMATCDVTFDIASSATANIVNSATVMSTVTPETTNTFPNTAVTSNPVNRQADLTIAKTDGLTSAVAGQSTIQYTITASNPTGPSDAPGSTIADMIPVELVSLSLVSCTPVNLATCDPGTPLMGNNLNATIDLPFGGAVTYVIEGQLAANATGTLSNTASVATAAGVTETMPANNSSTDDTTIVVETRLTIAKTGPATIVNPGGMATFTITVANPGPSDATGVTVTDTLPPELTFVAMGSDPKCMAAGQIVTCTPFDIVAGGMAMFDIVVSANAMMLGTVSNVASVDHATDPETPPAKTAMHMIQLVNMPPMFGDGMVMLETVGNTRLEVSGGTPLTPETEAVSGGAAPKDHSGVPAVQVTGNLLNDLAMITDPDGPSILFGFGVGAVSPTGMSANGGQVTFTNTATGEFTYDPPGGNNAQDSFTYTVFDGFNSPTGQVLIDFSGRIWFVDNSHTPAGDGTSVNPFNKLSDGAADSNPDDGEDASSAGDTIFVFEGDGTKTGQNSGIALLDNQRLIGEGVALDINVALNGGAAPTALFPAGNKPAIGNSGGAGVSAINVSVEIRGLNIANGTEVLEIAGGSHTAAVTDNMLTGNSPAFLAFTTAGSLELDFSRNTGLSTTSAADPAAGFDGSLGGTLTITGFADNVVDGSTAGGGIVVDTATFDADPSDMDFTGDTVPAGGTSIGVLGTPVGMSGMVLSNVSGDVNFGLASGVLDIFATNTGLQATGTGPIDAANGTGFRITVPDGSTIAGGVMAGPLTEAPSVVDEGAAAKGMTMVINREALILDPLTGFFGTSAGSGVTVLGENLTFTDVDGEFHFNSTSDIDSNSGLDAFSILYNSPISPLTAVFTYSGDLDVTAGGRLINVDGLDTGSSATFDDAGGASHTLGSTGGGGGISLNDVQGDFTLDADLTNLFGPAGNGISITGDSDGTLRFDDVSITSATGTAFNVDGTAGSIGATIIANNVDINQGAVGTVALIDNLGMGGSVDFDSASFITGTGTGTSGITISDNAAGTSITFGGDVNLGITAAGTLPAPRINSTGVTMTGNTGGGTPTTVSFGDLDIFTSGADGIFGTEEGRLTNTGGRIDTIDGAAININGSGATGIDFTNTTLNFATIVVNNTNASEGIHLEDFTGTANLGVVTLNTASGTALFASNGGKVTTLPGSTITSTSGKGIGASNVDFGTGSLHFNTVNAAPATAAVSGVSFTNTSGSANIMGGSIDGGAGGSAVVANIFDTLSLELVLSGATLGRSFNAVSDGTGGSTPILCLSLPGNTFGATGITLLQVPTGTLSVVQGSNPILAAVNGTTVLDLGAIAYGQGCLTGGGPFGTAPTAFDDTGFMVNEGASIDIDVLVDNGNGADMDPDADDVISLRAITVAPDMGGTAVIKNASEITYTGPTPIGANLTDTFMYEIVDKAGNTATAQVDVDVIDLPEPPVIATSPLNMETVGNTRLDLDDGMPLTPAPEDAANETRGPPARSRGGSRTAPDAGTAALEPKSHGGIPTVQVTGTLTTLAGVTDADSGFMFGFGAGAASATGSSTNSGTVTFTNQTTGEFTYDPPANCALASDSFTYVASDGTTDTMGTVNITHSGCIWFVDNSHSPNGDGTSATPFDNLTAAETASSAGEDVFVLEGDGTTTNQNSGITLNDNQRLIGEGVALTAKTAFTLPASGPPSQTLFPAGNKPAIDNSGVGTGVDANEVSVEIRGLSIASGTSVVETLGGSHTAAVTDNMLTGNIVAFAAGTLFGSLELDFSRNTGLSTTSPTQPAVLINGSGGGTLTITGFADNVVDGSTAGDGIVVNVATFDANPGDADFTGDTVLGGSTVVGTAADGVGGGASNGVQLLTVAGDLSFTDLDIDNDGSLSGLSVFGAGSLNAGAGTGFGLTLGAGSSIVSGGPAVDMNTATLNGTGVLLTGTLALFDTVDGTAGFSASSALTNNVTADVFKVIGASATITYAGTIVDDTGDGITLDSNTGGSVSFTGTVDLGTTAALTDDALEMTGNNASFAANFADLDIVTSNAVGILGTAAGMLDIDTGTVATTGESAIDIDGIDFGTTINLTNVTSNGTGMGDPGIDISNGSGTIDLGITNIGTGTPNNAIGVRVTSSSATISFTSLSIVNTSGDGIDISSSSGSFDVTGNTTIDTGSGAGIDVLGSTTDIGFGGALTITNAGTAINIDGTGGAPVDFDVAGTANLGVSGTNNVTTGISIASVGTSPTFTFTTVNIGTATTMPATTGFSFMNNTGAPTVNFGTALNVTNSGGPGIFAMSAGSIIAGAGIINTANGAGIDATGPTFAATFSVVSGGSGGVQRGINLEDIGGMLTMTTGTIPTGTTMEAFRVHGGNAIVSYGGGITNGADNGVLIEDVTGGSVTLSGAIDENAAGILVQNNTGGTFTFSGSSVDIDPSGANVGVTLSNNPGATINFTNGGLTIDTTTATGLFATGGGTVNASIDGGADNTITSTTGRAVDIDNVILGVTLSSVSSNGGANPGIDIADTTGSFTVSGGATAGAGCDTNTANCTGGTIQSKSGVGILLNRATNISLNGMFVSSTNDDGLRAGTTAGGDFVNGFTLTNSRFASNGNGVGEHGLEFRDLLGTATFTNVRVTGSREDAIRIFNNSGSLTSLTMSGLELDNNTSGSGLNLEAEATASITGVSITGGNFHDLFATGLLLANNSSGTLGVTTISGNTLTDNNIAIDVSAGPFSNTTTFNVLNNLTITGHASHAMNFFSADTGGNTSTNSFEGTISGNVIGTSGVPRSASTNGSAIRININDPATAKFLISGNMIHAVGPNGAGISAFSLLGAGTSHITITGNTIDEPEPANMALPPLEAIHLETGLGHNMCAKISSNTIHGPPVEDFGVPGGVFGGADVIGLEGTGTSFTLERNVAGSSTFVDQVIAGNTFPIDGAQVFEFDPLTGQPPATNIAIVTAGTCLTP